MADQELKEFINLKIDSLASHVQHLAALVESQAAVIRTIEITTTTRLTELRKDIDNAFEEIRNMKAEQKGLSDSQKFKWRTLSEERAKEKEELTKRWETQTEINQGIKTMTKLLWIVAGIVLSLLIGFIWQLIVNGGIRGIIGGQLP